MNQRFYPGSGTLLSAASLLLLAACASSGSDFGTGTGSGTSSTTTSSTTNGAAGDMGTGNPMGSGGMEMTGGAGDATGAGGGAGTVVSNAGGAGGAGPGTGGAGGSGGSGGAPPACPAGNGVNGICHEFYANDNSRNRINYVNEFVTTNPLTGKPMDATSIVWSVGVGDTTVNSPRTIEIVDNKAAKSGKAVLVSLNKGFGEFDTTDGTKVGGALTQTGVTGACRLSNGNTALAVTSSTGTMDYIRIVGPSGAQVSQFLLPPGPELRAINHNPADDTYWFSKTETVYQVNNQGQQMYKAFMGVGTKGYAVWWRAGGGAYATTGDPSSVVELDNSTPPKILTTVGGKGNTFPFLDFFSGFRRLDNGNYVIANWLGHVPDTLKDPWLTAPEVVEFAAPPANKIVWQWPRVAASAAYPNANQSVARQITNVYVLR